MEIYSKQLPLLWDAEVIVVGSGSAGATAAIAAAQAAATPEDCVFIGGSTFVVAEIEGL